MMKPFWNSWSITQLILFMVLTPIICVSLFLSYYHVHGRLQEIVQVLEIEGELIADHLSNDSEYYMFTMNKDKLQQLINDAIEHVDVESAEIYDKANQVIVFAADLEAVKSNTEVISVIRPIIYRDIVVDGSNLELESVDITVGWVRISMSRQLIEEKKKDIIFDSLLIFILGFAISAIIAFLISKSLFFENKRVRSQISKVSSKMLVSDLLVHKDKEVEAVNKSKLSDQQLSDRQEKKIDDATQALMDMVVELEQKNVLLDSARKEAEEVGNSKVEFLANMSHEIRTPLNAVIGASDLLMKTITSGDAVKYMTTLSVASRQLNSVVDDILDFSRMEANKLQLDRVAFNIIEVLENVISLYTPLAQEKKLELKLQVDPGMPVSIFGDPLRISQVVSNLVSNAIKFTVEGSVIVSASAIIKNNINLRLQINVIDTGAGLTPTAQEKLFDAFIQADSAIARKFGGSGLGLAIVRKLIEQMDGFINVKSNVDEGTEFNVYLDLMIDSSVIDDFENTLSGITVLLYEKDRVYEETVKTILQYWGIEIVTCQSDDDFIGHLMKIKSNGSSCDCIMLGMEHNILSTTTIEACVEKIRYLSSLPLVLMISAREYALPSQSIDNRLCCIAKPVNRQMLHSKLSTIHGGELNDIKTRPEFCAGDAVADTTSLFKDLNILIAEDNEFNRELLTDMLESYGAQVVAVEDGQYAVEEALKGSFDIVFLDLHMPRKDGITAANEIKMAALDKAPFLIAATADVFIKDQGTEVDVFDSFVFKPIREEVLLEKLTILLNFQGDYKRDETMENDADAVFSEKLDREVRKLVLHIVEGSNSDNYPEIVNFAHQLRGVCGFYELKDMTEIAAGLEKAAQEERREDVVMLIKLLLKQLNISPDYKTIH